jgi:hypothetical protein
MFGLGWVEIVVVLGAAYLAFRHFLARRFPGFRRAFDAVFYTTVALLIVFGLLTRVH